jgi:hypothetical protein
MGTIWLSQPKLIPSFSAVYSDAQDAVSEENIHAGAVHIRRKGLFIIVQLGADQ